MAVRVIYILLIFQGVSCEQPARTVNDGLIDTLSTGMKFAQNFLGSESVALKVAEFVVKAFQARNAPNRRPHNDNVDRPQHNDRYFQSNKHTDHEDSYNEYDAQNQSALDPLRHLVRLFGLQPPQLSAVAVNALVFVAQMISTFFSGPQKPNKPYKSGDPTSWILNKNSRKLQELITVAKNESLPLMIEDIIGEQGNEEEISCIRLLICKVTPFVAKMQKTVFGEKENETSNESEKSEEMHRGASVMYRHLPTTEEIKARGNICERKYSACDLNY